MVYKNNRSTYLTQVILQQRVYAVPTSCYKKWDATDIGCIPSVNDMYESYSAAGVSAAGSAGAASLVAGAAEDFFERRVRVVFFSAFSLSIFSL